MESAIVPSAGAQLTTSGDLNAAAESWSRFIGRSDRTRQAYTDNIRRFLQYCIDAGQYPPTEETVYSYKEHLERKYKATTASAYLAAVRLFFRWTASRGVYPNIADNVHGAKISRDHKRDDLKPDECAAVLEGIDRSTERGARDYAIIALMITCGLRDIEVVRADVQDIAKRGDKIRLYLMGKGKQERTDYVHIPPEALDAIRDYMQLRTNREGRTVDGSAPLFASLSNNNSGGRMTTRAVSGIAKNALQAAGFDDSRITAHSLRHAAVSNALRGGEDLRAVQQFARHADISTTLVYAHDLERENNTVSDTIARLVFRKEGAEQRAAGQ